MVTVSGGEFNGSVDLGNIDVSGGQFTDNEVAKHLKSGKAVLFHDGKYAVANEEAVKGDAIYSVTNNADGTVVYFTDLQAANDYAKESGAQSPKVLKVTVNFESNQGTAVDSQLVTVGDKVAKPADPTKEGYTFTGWFSDEDCTKPYDFDVAVDDTVPELTLHAGWKASAPSIVKPGTGDNANNGGNGDNAGKGDGINNGSNAANGSNANNGDKTVNESKTALAETGDNLTLVGGAIALIAVTAAAVAAFALRRRKMN